MRYIDDSASNGQSMEVPGVKERVTKYLQKAQKENLGGDVEDAMVNCRRALESMVQDDYSEVFPEKKKKYRPIPDMLVKLNKEPDSRFNHPLTNLIGYTINGMTRGSAHDTELQWSSDANTPVDASLAITLVLYLLNKAYDIDIGSFVLLQQYVDDNEIDRGLREAISYGSGEHEDDMISRGVLEVAELIEERGGQLGYRELRETGIAAQRIGQFEVAIGHYRQALRTLENDDGDLREILILRAWIADVKMSLGELEDAKIDYQKIIEDYRNHPIMNPPPPDDMEIILLQKLAQVQILTSTYISVKDKIRESLPLFLEAASLLEKDPSQSDVLLLRRIAQNYEALGEEKKASEYTKRWKESLIEIFKALPETITDSDSPIAHLMTEVIIETDLDLEEKLDMINYFLDRAKAENNRLREISITGEIANIHLEAGDREKAAEYLRICIDFYRKHGGGEGPAQMFDASFRLLQILDADSPEYQELLAETEELVEERSFYPGKQALLGLTFDERDIDDNSDPEQKISRVREGIYLLEALHREPEPQLEIIAETSEALGSLFLGEKEDREILSVIMTRDDALGYLREALEIHKSLDSDTEVIQKLYDKLLSGYMVSMEPNSVDFGDLTDYWFSLIHDEMLYFQQIGKTSEFSQHLNEFLGANPLLGRVLRSTNFGQELFGIPGILEKLEDPDISASMKEKYQAQLDAIFEPSFRQREVRYKIRLPYKIGMSLLSLTILTIPSSLLYYLLMISNLGNLVTAVGVIILLPFLIILLRGVSAVLPIWRRTHDFEDLVRFGLMEVDEESNIRITGVGMIALTSPPAIDEEE